MHTTHVITYVFMELILFAAQPLWAHAQHKQLALGQTSYAQEQAVRHVVIWA